MRHAADTACYYAYQADKSGWPDRRNADDRLARRTSPFISEITKRTELVDALRFQFAVKLLHKSLERRTSSLSPSSRMGFASIS